MITRDAPGYAKRGLLLGLAIDALLSPALAQDLSLRQPKAGVAAQLISPLSVRGSSNSLATPATLPVEDIARRDFDRAVNPLWSTPLASFRATRDRPIFSPTRRPAPGATPAPVQVHAPVTSDQPSQPPFVLLGAIAGEEEDIAILLDQSTKGVVRLRTGEGRSGWVLRSVKGRQATLQRDRQTAVLTIPIPAAK